MKFVCLDCDHPMEFADRKIPGDGTLSAVFACDGCGREIAMLANPMETQLVSSMGVQIGGREVPEQPMELTRSSLEGGRDEAFEVVDGPEDRKPDGPEPAAGESTSSADGEPGRVEWSDEALERLQRVPRFVRGMVKRIYTDYAQQREIGTMTPEIMDRARSDLGLEGM